MKQRRIITEKGIIGCDIANIDADGLPMLYINGGPCGGLSENLKITLSQIFSDRPIIFYSAMNSKNSAPKNRNDKSYWNLDYYSQEVNIVLDGLGVSRFSIYSHSWGSAVATWYMSQKQNRIRCEEAIFTSPLICTRIWERDVAKRLLQIEDDVTAAVAKQTALIHSKNKAKNRYIPDRQAIYNAVQMAMFYHRFVNSSINEQYLYRNLMNGVTLKDMFGQGYEVYSYMWGPSEFTCNGTLKDMDLRPLIVDISHPVLFMTGDSDEVLTSTASEYARSMPCAHYIELSGTHSFIVENPIIESIDKIQRYFYITTLQNGEPLNGDCPVLSI